MAELYPRFDLDGQVALVTGANRGLGRAIALALAHAGADVVAGVRDPASADSVVAEIAGMGRRACAVRLDVTRTREIAGAVDEAVAAMGRIEPTAPSGLATPLQRPIRRPVAVSLLIP